MADETLEHTVLVVDGHAATLEAHFNTLLELKLLHPAAWDASEGGRSASAHEAALAQLLTESLAMVFGLRWPDQPDGRSASEPASGRTAAPLARVSYRVGCRLRHPVLDPFDIAPRLTRGGVLDGDSAPLPCRQAPLLRTSLP